MEGGGSLLEHAAHLPYGSNFCLHLRIEVENSHLHLHLGNGKVAQALLESSGPSGGISLASPAHFGLLPLPPTTPTGKFYGSFDFRLISILGPFGPLWPDWPRIGPFGPNRVLLVEYGANWTIVDHYGTPPLAPAPIDHAQHQLRRHGLCCGFQPHGRSRCPDLSQLRPLHVLLLLW